MVFPAGSSKLTPSCSRLPFCVRFFFYIYYLKKWKQQQQQHITSFVLNYGRPCSEYCSKVDLVKYETDLLDVRHAGA